MTDCPIWIVDDDLDDLDLIEQAFKECSYMVRKFNGIEGQHLLSKLLSTEEKALPQLILLDINMPVISGKRLLAMIREDPVLKHLPVAMFTTSNSQREKLECFELGANCFLTKPYDFQSMIRLCCALTVVFCSNRS